MRKQFASTIKSIVETDQNFMLLLGDIGVYSFSELMLRFPKQIYNVGILEQSTIGLAAGLSASGFHPTIHTIAPFMVERSLEQIKIDFSYQGFSGNLVSVGSSYDYASLGCTHHCPADVAILQNIPNIEILVPGHSKEFDRLFNDCYKNDKLSYFRLSEYENSEFVDLETGKAKLIKIGRAATIVVVGPFFSRVLEATNDLDVTIIYYNCVSPFDGETLRQNFKKSGKVIAIGPFYQNTLIYPIVDSLRGQPSSIFSIGIPIVFADNYGSVDQHDAFYGLDVSSIRAKVISIIEK